MALFSSSDTSTKNPDTVALQKEIAAMKEADRLRRKYGANLTDEELAAYVEKDRIRAAEQKEAEAAKEADLLLKIQRDKDIRKLAVQLVKEQKLIVALNGTRISEIKPDILIPCPSCGLPLTTIQSVIYEIATAWHDTAPEHWFSMHSPWIIYNSRNPLGHTIGIRAYMNCVQCPGCKASVNEFCQVVVL